MRSFNGTSNETFLVSGHGVKWKFGSSALIQSDSYGIHGEQESPRLKIEFMGTVYGEDVGIYVTGNYTRVDIGASAEPAPEQTIAAEPEAVVTASTEEGVIEAPEMAFERLEAPRGAPDELTRITGLGPTLEQKLNEAGIFHFWQIAAMSDADGEAIEEQTGSKGRIKLDAWRDEARKFIEGAAA